MLALFLLSHSTPSRSFSTTFVLSQLVSHIPQPKSSIHPSIHLSFHTYTSKKNKKNKKTITRITRFPNPNDRNLQHPLHHPPPLSPLRARRPRLKSPIHLSPPNPTLAPFLHPNPRSRARRTTSSPHQILGLQRGPVQRPEGLFRRFAGERDAE